MPPDENIGQWNRQPPVVDEAYKQSQIAFRENNFERAISLCRQILQRMPDSGTAFNLLAQSLQRTGAIRDEIDTLKSVVDSGKEVPGIYEKLGELQRVAGDNQDAIASLERAAALKPRKAIIRVILGIIRYRTGDIEASEKEFMRVLEIDPKFVPAHFFLGNIHRKRKNPREAFESYSTAVELDASYAPAVFRLADILYERSDSEDRTGDLNRAAGLTLGVIGNGEANFGNHLLTGKILVELERYEEAVKILEAAGSLGKIKSDYFVALSVAYWKLGKIARARDVSRRHMREFPVGLRRSANAEAEVLVLETLRDSIFKRELYGAQTFAHANTIGSLPSERVSLHHMFIDGIKESKIESLKGKYGVIYNNAANAETNALLGYGEMVQNILDRTGLPVVNAPGMVKPTTRDQNYLRLQEIDHLIFPKTIAVTPNAENAAEIVERVEAEFKLPVLVRRAGGHRATELAIAEDIDALRELLTRFADEHCYVIQYHESKHPSGNFVMHRCVFVDGKFYPGRMYLSSDWLVSGPQLTKRGEFLIKAKNEFQDEEKQWLADPEGMLGEANMAALHAVNEVMKLDCYGADTGIAEDGRLIVFEVNSCMNCLGAGQHVPKFPYLRPSVRDIVVALEDLLIDKAGGRG